MTTRGGSALATAMFVSAALALLKYAFGLFSGSLVLIASAADSFADAVVSGINFWGYRWARTPPDHEHPFGHGKMEGILATGQGALLIGLSTSIGASAVSDLITGPALPKTSIAAVVLGVSTLSAAFLTFLMSRASRKDHSTIVAADAAHYRTDLVSGALAVASMLAAGFTGWIWLDPIAAIFAALWMIREAIRVLKSGIADLLDVALPPEQLAAIDGVLLRHRPAVVEFHGLRTRRSGPLSFVEVHAVMPPEKSLSEVHELVQKLSREIREAVPSARVMIHPDAQGLRDETDVLLEDGVRGEK